MENKKEKKPVVFVETNMVRKLSPEVRETFLSKVTGLGYKIYDSNNQNSMLRLLRPNVIRFGCIPDRIAITIKVKGGTIVSGDI